ncbi:hypothetical protein CPB85DRAFT_1258796 [Mucidula mucida]|nr:hypothetical protein CPB85DRAFT_1258796 [Mucidula mucida]
MAWFLGILTSSSCSQAHEPGPSAEIYKAFSMPWLFYRFASGWITIGHGSRCMTTTINGRRGPVASSQSDDGGQAALTISSGGSLPRRSQFTRSAQAFGTFGVTASGVGRGDGNWTPGTKISVAKCSCTPSCDGVILSVYGNVASPCATAPSIPPANGYDVLDDGASKSALRLSAWMVSVMCFTEYSRMRIVSRLIAVVRPLSKRRRYSQRNTRRLIIVISIRLNFNETTLTCWFYPEGHSKSVVGGVMMTFKRLSTLKIDERTRPNFVFPALSLPWGIRGLRIYHYTPSLPSPSVSPPTPAPLCFKIPIELINHLPTLGMYGECIF